MNVYITFYKFYIYADQLTDIYICMKIVKEQVRKVTSHRMQNKALKFYKRLVLLNFYFLARIPLIQFISIV